MSARLLLLAALLICAAISAVARRTPVDLLHPSHASSPSKALYALPPLVQDLTSHEGGVEWSVSSSGGNVTGVAATVPGDVYTDLFRAGVLDSDPLYRDNELRFRWVAMEDSWTWAASFDLADASMLQYAAVQLECDGIDTAASVELNGQMLGRTDNMHLRYTFDVLPWLRSNNNQLRVRIRSPLAESERRAAAYPYVVPRTVQLGSLPHGNFLRKGQSDYGWDWGPAFAASGIWMPLRLVAFQQARMVGALVHQYHAAGMDDEQRAALGGVQAGDVLLRVGAFLRANDASAATAPVTGQLCASIELGSGAGAVSNCTIVALSDADLLGERRANVWLTVPAGAVQLWWPAGYGAQPLFNLVATFTDGGGSASSLTRRVGFRTVELVREAGPEGQEGLSFYFRVNSLPIFIKGANMIPLSLFHGRVTDSAVRSLLRSLLDSGGNTVRVWGGGVYQRESLYDYADEHGILVWQEFMFACAMYPRDQAFLHSARREVAHQTRRLAGHASMLVLGGNNENEAAMTWFPETLQFRDLYLVDYTKLFLDTVRDQVLHELGGGGTGGPLTGLPFVSSSPSRGPLSEEPYVQMWGAAQSNDYGDVHYYNYWADCSNVTLLPRARFVSEFGFQSLPSLYTLEREMSEAHGDLEWNSTQLQYRQRHAGGYEEIAAQAALHFRLPDARDPAQLLEDWIYMSQSVQSLCYRTALTHWRRIKQESPGRTMGAIYWQLNDLWAGPTWSGIEHPSESTSSSGSFGRWKPVQYEVKRAFAPVIVSGFYDAPTDQVVAYLTSDLNAPLRARVHLNVSSWTSGLVWRAEDVRVELLRPLQSMRVWRANLTTLYAEAGCPAPEQCYIALGASVDPVRGQRQRQHKSDGATQALQPIVVPRAEIFPRPLRLAPLRVPSFILGDFAPQQVCASPDNTDDVSDGPGFIDESATLLLSASFTLSSDVCAAGVFLSTPLEGRFDDNSFVMDAGQRRTITFSAPPATSPHDPPPTPFTLQQLRDSLRVTSLRHVYSDQSNDDRVAAVRAASAISTGAATAARFHEHFGDQLTPTLRSSARSPVEFDFVRPRARSAIPARFEQDDDAAWMAE